MTPVIAPAAEISQLDESIATVFRLPPIATAPVDVPVAIFTGKLEEAFRFTVPPVIVSPALPVIRPAAVIVPPLLVVILPLVATVPSSFTVKLGVPFDCKESKVLFAALVSLMTMTAEGVL